MKVALTIWEGRISPVFDVFREAWILEVEGERVLCRSRLLASCANPRLKVRELLELGVEVLVCGAISAELGQELTSCGVRVIGFVSGPALDVEAALLAGRLPSREFCMPGCHARHGHCRGGRGRGRA